jgi:hypothetical protein
VALCCAPGATANWERLSSGRPAIGHTAAASPVEVLRRAQASFGARAGSAKRDPSSLLRRLALALPRLHGADHRRAARLLARPSDGASDPQQNGWTAPEAPGSPLCSAHYCVHWVAAGPDAPDLTDANANGIPDWVETVDGVAENVYSVENGQLGWRPPKPDGTRGGNALTDIYLSDIGGSGIYGYTAPDPNQRITDNDHSQWAYLVVDNDFSLAQFPGYASALTPLEVTVAHEYNHVLQFNYDSLEDTWMLESTAVWAEGKVYEPVHDYLQYLPGWAQLTTQPITQFNGQNPNDRNNVKVYGSTVWNKWLDTHFGPTVVRGAWEDSIHTKPQSFAPLAYDASIHQHGGGGFSDQFDRFAAATAEWQARDSGFPEGALYPDVKRSGTLAVNGSPGTVDLDHTAFALVKVPATTARRIKLAVVAPRGTASALALVARTGGAPGGTATVVLHELPHGGGGTVVLPAPSGFERLTAAIVNSDVSQRGFSNSTQEWLYSRDHQRFIADVSTDFTRPVVRRMTPRRHAVVAPGQNVTARFSEPMLGVSRTSFELIGAHGRPVAARVKFSNGGRTATLTPRRNLRAGGYRVRMTNAITDVALNPVRPPRAWRFTAR